MKFFTTHLDSDNFYRLLFHWAWQVRHIFYNYLLYILLVKLFDYKKKKSNEEVYTGQRIAFKPPSRSYSLDREENQSYNIVSRFVQLKIDEIQDIYNYAHSINCNPVYKTVFSFDEYNAYSKKNLKIDKNLESNVINGLFHFQSVLKDFNNWKDNNEIKKITQFVYPVMAINEMKDDIVDYSENW